MEIFDINRDCRETSASAMEEMVKCAQSFEEWRNIFDRCLAGGVSEKQAFLQMATCAKSFGHWLNIYCEPQDDKVVKKVALEQLMKLANDPVDADPRIKDPKILRVPRWQKIFDIVPLDGKEQALAELAIHNFLIEQKRANVKEKKDSSASKI